MPRHGGPSDSPCARTSALASSYDTTAATAATPSTASAVDHLIIRSTALTAHHRVYDRAMTWLTNGYRVGNEHDPSDSRGRAALDRAGFPAVQLTGRPSSGALLHRLTVKINGTVKQAAVCRAAVRPAAVLQF